MIIDNFNCDLEAEIASDKISVLNRALNSSSLPKTISTFFVKSKISSCHLFTQNESDKLRAV